MSGTERSCRFRERQKQDPQRREKYLKHVKERNERKRPGGSAVMGIGPASATALHVFGNMGLGPAGAAAVLSNGNEGRHGRVANAEKRKTCEQYGNAPTGETVT